MLSAAVHALSSGVELLPALDVDVLYSTATAPPAATPHGCMGAAHHGWQSMEPAVTIRHEAHKYNPGVFITALRFRDERSDLSEIA
eukprot:363885-Chlamydomonas_euryale.AAC.8